MANAKEQNNVSKLNKEKKSDKASKAKESKTNNSTKLAKKAKDSNMLDFENLSKNQLIKKISESEKDTGSPEVQVALLTKKILELIGHLKIHKKDKHSRRGLLQMIGKRRRLMEYLKRKDTKKYQVVLEQNGLSK